MENYVKIEKGYVTDCIQIEHEGYIETTAEVPSDVMNGCYKLKNNKLVVDEAKYQEFKQSQRDYIIDEYTLKLIEMGVL